MIVIFESAQIAHTNATYCLEGVDAFLVYSGDAHKSEYVAGKMCFALSHALSLRGVY